MAAAVQQISLNEIRYSAAAAGSGQSRPVHGRHQGKAMTSPYGAGKIRIPLNEEARQGSSQIEVLMQFNGEGIWHIALICDSLVGWWTKLGLAAYR